jgi:hypothetical protein
LEITLIDANRFQSKVTGDIISDIYQMFRKIPKQMDSSSKSIKHNKILALVSSIYVDAMSQSIKDGIQQFMNSGSITNFLL